MLHENDYRRKAALINRFWDAFDVPSDDPNIDHKYNRDYLWDKMFQYQPNEFKFDKGPTGIENPADYIGKVTIEKDTNNDGDFDEKITKE